MEEKNYISKAKECYRHAEKKKKPGVLGKIFSNREERMSEAAELFKQAANYYRLGKDYKSAAEAFVQCANCVPEEAHQHYSEAGNLLRKVNTSEAIEYYNRAVEMLASSGRIGMAAKLRKQIAEIYEGDDMLGSAVQNYEHAAELFELDNSESTANSCHLKVAELSTQDSLDSNTILKAIKLFETVGQRYLQHNLTKFSAKDCYFKAVILFMANEDIVGAENALQNYFNRDPSFETSREGKLAQELISDIRASNVNSFESHLYQYNNITPLDRWKTKVLIKAKNMLNAYEEPDFS